MDSREGEMEIQKGEAVAAEAGAEVMAPSRFRRICVFCGSSMGKKASYQDAAVELGQELVSRNIDLVYGGGGLGLMGVVVSSSLQWRTACRWGDSHGPNVKRVSPLKKYHMHEMFEEAGDRQQVPLLLGTLDLTNEHPPFKITGETIGEVKVVSDMHQRKAEMTRLSDAFIALPGGYGTLEELFEAITWAQLGIHDKPVGVLNVDGYYDALVSYIDTAVEEGFIQPTARHIMVLAPTPKELLDKLETYSPRHKEVAPKMKWELDQKVSCSENHVVPAQCGNML